MSEVSALPSPRRRKASSCPTARLTYNRGDGFKVPFRELSAALSISMWTVRMWVKIGMPVTSVRGARKWIDANQVKLSERKKELQFKADLASAFGITKGMVHARMKLGMPTDSIPAALEWWQKRWDSIHPKKIEKPKRIFLKPVEQACSCCFKTFVQKRIAKYCSRECSYEASRKPPHAVGNCQTCGKEILKKKIGYKFCSDACYAKSLIKVYPWEQMAVALYENTDLGFKRIAKQLNAPAHAVIHALKKLGIVDYKRKQKAESARRKLHGCEWIKKPEWTTERAEALIIEGLKREVSRLRKFDEVNHWSNHVEVNRFRARINSIKKYHSWTKEQKREWNLKIIQRRDPVKYRNKINAWKRNQTKTNPGYRLRCSLSSRLSDMMNGKKGFSILDYLGCSQNHLKQHIQNLFRRGMTWQNYGTYWQVDHILPCAAFDHTDIQQVKICWNWQNLRPLEADKNLEKSDTITEPQQHLPLCLS